eukprot:TRINITY_DN9642_c0_g2_i1.p1 TRINITY_DN9642_c0_g2~~TRINITY_DN9642_c0_g2_i1.p1  ORF type:complete len:447 (-),score=49.45 TRINITY_DN9642_c0_g2_i1:43-1383(-)
MADGNIFLIVIGVLFGLGALIFLWIQERSYIVDTVYGKIAKMEAEEINNESPDPEHDGKLVFTRGKLMVARVLEDIDFSIKAQDSLHLLRSVEVLQWEESTHRNNNRRHYSYSTTWSKRYINSGNFYNPGYHNPNNFLINEFMTKQRPEETLFGNFNLNETLVDLLIQDQTDRVPIEGPPQLSPGVSQTMFGSNVFRGMQVVDNYIYFTVDGSIGTVGTMRVSFWKSPAGYISFCSEQQGKSFKPHNFVTGSNNIRSKVLLQAIERRRNVCFGISKCCLIGEEEMSKDFELAKHGNLERKDFFRSFKEKRRNERICAVIVCFILLWCACTPISYRIKRYYTNSVRYTYLLDGVILVPLWILLNQALAIYPVKPGKSIKKLAYAAVFLALFVWDCYLFAKYCGQKVDPSQYVGNYDYGYSNSPPPGYNSTSGPSGGYGGYGQRSRLF